MTRKSLAIVFVMGCGPAVGDEGTGEATGSSGSSSSATSGITASSTTVAMDTSGSGSSSETSTSADDVDDTSDDGPICILHHHEVAPLGDCDGDSDCCPGEKCVPSEDYSECVPLDDTPAGVGEPCVRTGVSDDCVAGTVCRGSDPETNEGRCVEFCTLGHGCNGASTFCAESPLDLCLLPCDPLGEDAVCPGTDVCLPMAEAQAFACVPDELPEDSGVAGDPCPAGIDAFAGCDAGHMCLADKYVEIMSCADDDESGCCTQLCAIGDPVACAGIGTETCVPLSMLFGEAWTDALGVGYCG